MREADRKTLLEAARRELLRRQAKDDYYKYLEYVHPLIFKGTKVSRYIAKTVQTFLETPCKGAYDLLVIECPPQHGKSMTVTETLPSWYLGRNPDKSVICISYDQDFAEKFGLRNRQKVAAYGEELFGVTLSAESRKKTDFEIQDRRGSMRSRGIKGGVTGNPCDLMIIDDPVRNQETADSAAYRQHLINEWYGSYRSRLSAGAKVIVIETPWHAEDLAGFLLENEPGTQLLRLPCECDSKDDPLGRKIGDALAPELGKDNAWLQDFKARTQRQEGLRAWNALYQCRPTSEQGNLIKRDWWQWYDKAPRMAQEIISIDAAFKGGEQNDFVAIQCWGKSGADAYLLDSDKRHMDFPTTLEAVRKMAKAHPNARPIYIEDKANGSAIIQMLQHEIPGIVPVNPQGGKQSRVNAVSGFIEAGNVYLKKGMQQAEELVESCAAFPFGTHDDDVDAMSQGLNKLYYFTAETEEEEPDDYDDQLREIFG